MQPGGRVALQLKVEFGAVWVQWCPVGRMAELWSGEGCAVVPWILGGAGDTLNATCVTAVTAKEQPLL